MGTLRPKGPPALLNLNPLPFGSKPFYYNILCTLTAHSILIFYITQVDNYRLHLIILNLNKSLW